MNAATNVRERHAGVPVATTGLVETYRGAVYPWHCDHIDTAARRATAFPDDVKAAARARVVDFALPWAA